jgi:hypothetical protein
MHEDATKEKVARMLVISKNGILARRLCLGAWMVIAVAIVGGLFLLIPSMVFWRVKEFKGDGTITDNGLFSYPRFEVRFPVVQLQGSEEYSFVFQGMPSERLYFGLRVLNKISEDELNASDMKIMVRFVEGTDSVVCEAEGTVKKWKKEIANGERITLWHMGCRDIHFYRKKTYKLLLSVKTFTGEARQIIAEPTLWGGGFETP